MLLHYALGREMQVAGPRVIAQAAPEGEHLVLARRGQRPHVGKPRDELLVIRDDGRDLSLLQHDLRQPDSIGVARALPWQPVAAVLVLPGDDAFTERGEGLLAGAGHGGRW